MALTTAQKVRRSLARDGLAATVWLVARNVGARVDALLPWTRRKRYRETAFDRQFGIETTAPVARTDLDIPAALVDHIVRYDPTSVEGFRRVLEALDIDHAAYRFVDLGAGKGRTLLLASELPFREIIGVELSPKLSAVAARNIARYRSPTQRCRNIRCVCTDAAQFQFPPGPLVLYLYNPFHLQIMTAVMERLERSLRDDPRDVLIAYVNPQYRDCLDRLAWLRPLTSGSLSARNWPHHQPLPTDQSYIVYAFDRGGLATSAQ